MEKFLQPTHFSLRSYRPAPPPARAWTIPQRVVFEAASVRWTYRQRQRGYGSRRMDMGRPSGTVLLRVAQVIDLGNSRYRLHHPAPQRRLSNCYAELNLTGDVTRMRQVVDEGGMDTRLTQRYTSESSGGLSSAGKGAGPGAGGDPGLLDKRARAGVVDDISEAEAVHRSANRAWGVYRSAGSSAPPRPRIGPLGAARR
jgi:hypothetical protein